MSTPDHSAREEGWLGVLFCFWVIAATLKFAGVVFVLARCHRRIDIFEGVDRVELAVCHLLQGMRGGRSRGFYVPLTTALVCVFPVMTLTCFSILICLL